MTEKMKRINAMPIQIPNVYVVHEIMVNNRPIHDTTSAVEFGDRRVLVRTCGAASVMYDEDDPLFIGSESGFMTEATAKINKGLETYTKADYLLLVGAPKLIAVASAVAAHRVGGLLRLLVWQNRYSCYVPIEERLWGGKVDDDKGYYRT